MADSRVEDAEALHAAVALASRDENGANTRVFSQEDLLGLSDRKEMKDVMSLVQYLTDNSLFRTLKVKGKFVWSARPREAAKQIADLDRNDKMIYEVIEEAHTSGVWSREIRRKTSIPQNGVLKSLNKMEKSNLIKSVTSIKSPHQKTYMLFHLVPSEDVTGNSFFDAGDLDESFRDELLRLIVFWVRKQSWVDGKRPLKRASAAAAPDTGVTDGPTEPQTAGKRKRANDMEDAGQPPRAKARSNGRARDMEDVQLTYRVGTHDYPTAKSIHHFLINSNVIKPTKAASITVSEIQGCIDVLVWDDKLEPVPNKNQIERGYRTVRGVVSGLYEEEEDETAGTGLTQAPCGRCPVLDLCTKGGPVNPVGCVYYDQWLKE